MKPFDAYRKRIELLEAEIAQLSGRHNIFSFVRLILFLLSGVSVYLFAVGYSFFMPLTAIAAFVAILLIDGKLVARLKLKRALKALSEDEIASDKNHSHRIFSNGSANIDPKHPYSFDIDVFGEGSLFKHINRTVTPLGEARLSETLKVVNKNTNEIKARQASVGELAENTELRQGFIVEKYLNPHVPEDDVNKLLESDELLTINSENIIYRLLLILFPLVFILSVVLASAEKVSNNVPFTMFILQLAIVGNYVKRINGYHRIIDSISKNLKRDARLLKTIEKYTFRSELIANLKRELIEKDGSALSAIKQSELLLNAFENRMNMVVSFLLNGVYMRDLWLILRFNRWLKKYKNEVPLWMAHIAEFDELISIANFNFNNPDFIFPDPEGTWFLKSEELGHPLIDAEKRVCNNFTITSTGELHIVTGANMSGKSTFLRTALINLVLASTGSAVCAKEFSYKPASIFSSIRTFDNLIDDVSYFQAELIRLKQMMEEAAKGEPVVIAIDEPLKGTNSEDKRKGSILLLGKMVELPVCGLVATHDLELKVLAENDKRFHLICFELRFEGEKVIYDYTLREGVTTTMNATILMKNMGLI
ncbi:hypothetical protein ACE1ET_03255 [Saccharicrinis sp. FJH62]|uniref:MutS-related protein n=1 Tax=Saccharicrinis sp. FJH62 TaxID=3344657 RepID=UPI0035D410DC